MLALLLVAASVGVSNFAAAIGIGAAGVDAGTRLRVGLIFGIFEAGMPVLGLLLGQNLAPALGSAAHWIGAALLIVAGGYAVLHAVRSQARDQDQPPAGADQLRTGRLVVTGIALSIDNLAIGFALGAYHVNLAVAAVIIGIVSVTLSLAGLELGDRLGTKVGERGELIGGLVLIGVGIALASGILGLRAPNDSNGDSDSTSQTASISGRQHPWTLARSYSNWRYARPESGRSQRSSNVTAWPLFGRPTTLNTVAYCASESGISAVTTRIRRWRGRVTQSTEEDDRLMDLSWATI